MHWIHAFTESVFLEMPARQVHTCAKNEHVLSVHKHIDFYFLCTNVSSIVHKGSNRTMLPIPLGMQLAPAAHKIAPHECIRYESQER